MDIRTSYLDLEKPSWAPAPPVFGNVWSVLYTLIAISYGWVAYLYRRKRIPRHVILPFALNLCTNFLFTWLQFGLQNSWLATIDILFVLITIPWTMKVIWPYAKWVALFQIPYLIWVAIATTLQIQILLLNI